MSADVEGLLKVAVVVYLALALWWAGNNNDFN
jgi:hypothetical protein